MSSFLLNLATGKRFIMFINIKISNSRLFSFLKSRVASDSNDSVVYLFSVCVPVFVQGEGDPTQVIFEASVLNSYKKFCGVSMEVIFYRGIIKSM